MSANLLKLVLRAFTEMEEDDLKLCVIIGGSMVRDVTVRAIKPANQEDVDKAQAILDTETGAEHINRKRDEYGDTRVYKPKAKRKAKVKRDPAEELANRKGGKGKKDAPAPYKATTGLRSHIHGLLKQTTGKIGPAEIAEFLVNDGVKTTLQKVSASLCDVYLRNPKLTKEWGLKREATRNASGRAAYVYWLEG